MSFEELPNELIGEIEKYLYFVDKRCLAGVNKWCSDIIKPKDNFWREIGEYQNKYKRDIELGLRNPYGKEVIFGGVLKIYNDIIITKVNSDRFLILTPKNYSIPHYKEHLKDIGGIYYFMKICDCGTVLGGSKVTVNKHCEAIKHIHYILANDYNHYLTKLWWETA